MVLDSKLLVLSERKIEFLDLPGQVLRDLQVAFNERPLDRKLCYRRGQLLCR